MGACSTGSSSPGKVAIVEIALNRRAMCTTSSEIAKPAPATVTVVSTISVPPKARKYGNVWFQNKTMNVNNDKLI
eukprot:6374805-Amphidinium_carterae.1